MVVAVLCCSAGEGAGNVRRSRLVVVDGGSARGLNEESSVMIAKGVSWWSSGFPVEWSGCAGGGFCGGFAKVNCSRARGCGYVC